MTPIDYLTPYLKLLPIKSKTGQFSENEWSEDIIKFNLA